MTGLDIEAIRERARFAEPHIVRHKGLPEGPLSWTAADVPVLLAQIERERAALDEALATVREQAAEIERLRAELLEEQTVHAKTFDNFESHTEACLEERTRQLDRYARLDAKLAARTKLLTDELTYARAALADALQVIADLRGGAT